MKQLPAKPLNLIIFAPFALNKKKSLGTFGFFPGFMKVVSPS
jgi:hypothetical protein